MLDSALALSDTLRSMPGEHESNHDNTLKQEWTVEGLIVGKTEEGPQYVVTDVISGGETVYDGFYPPLRSPNAQFILSSQDFSKASYRALVIEQDYKKVRDDPYNLDALLRGDSDIAVGDRVRIQRWSHQEPQYDEADVGAPRWWVVHQYDATTTIERGIDIDEEEEKVLRRKQYIRENFAAIIRRLEQLQLEQQPRLQNEVATPIAWRHDEATDIFRARYTYGEGAVKDHFVDVVATPYIETDSVPLGGDMRFTRSGRTLLARDVVVAGSVSKEVAIIDEPPVALSAYVRTETAMNPEVAAVHVDFIIDGVRYKGLQDPELSSRSFENPGHHLHFDSFAVDGEYDGIEISDEELKEIDKYNSIRGDLALGMVYAELSAKIARNQLEGAGSAPVSASISNMLASRQQLQELELARAEAYEALRPTIHQIKARPSDLYLGIGGRLLVPRSKLGAVQVVVCRRGEGS